MPAGRQRNDRLAATLTEAGWTREQAAAAFVRVALENGARGYAAPGHSHISRWVAGTRPSGRAPGFLAEALSRRLRRIVSLEEIGLADGGTPVAADAGWDADTLAALSDLGRIDASMDRRHALSGAVYAAAALPVPKRAWWASMAVRGADRAAADGCGVGRADVAAVRETTALFSRMDQRHGGGHGRTAVAQYLAVDVVRFLRGRYSDEATRRQMFTAASELSYVCGWMAFDNAEQATAQRYFVNAVKLAAEADDPAMAGHVLRAMAHQAIDLKHYKAGLRLATGSVEGDRYRLASPRERALIGVVYAKALGNTGNTKASAAALIRAEDDLAAAGDGEEPARVFFFGEASLAHETACTLRDTGDIPGAILQFQRSVRTRKAAAFTRTHAVTLGLLGSLHAQSGNVEEACEVWRRALDAMDGVHSARTAKVAADMRTALSPFCGRGIKATAEIDARAAAYLKTAA